MGNAREAFVTVDAKGQLSLNGERVRFWGAIGTFPENAKAPELDLLADRLKLLGFNMVRYWSVAETEQYTRGDGSETDRGDYFIKALKDRGMYVWAASPGNRLGNATASDVSILSEPESEASWREAVGEGFALRDYLAMIWDPRLEALGIERHRQNAQHLNLWTGLRWSDDPVMAIWELSNEEWWFGKMISGQWQTLPQFFQKQLLSLWNRWLLNKYQTPANLLLAWRFLLPEEDLEGQSILLLPLRDSSLPVSFNDVSPVAQAAFARERQAYTRGDFVRTRGEDVIEFFLEIWLSHKQRRATALKTWGQSCAACPLVWDTGIGYEIQAQYMLSRGDAVAHDTYLQGTTNDPRHQRYPFISGLDEPPRMALNMPWVEHNRVEGKPYFVYETQISNITKYRAEFPYRVAALASIQDWDVVCWHYYGVPPVAGDPKPFTRALDQGHSLDLHFQYDEVQVSAMLIAARVFRDFQLKPAPTPTQFVFGRKALLDPASMDPDGSYGEIGTHLMPTTYRHGVRLRIDPTLEANPSDPVFESKEHHAEFCNAGFLVKGPHLHPHVYQPNPVRPTEQISYDWQRGHLMLEAERIASYAGFFAQFGSDRLAFSNHPIVAHSFTFHNPGSTPYPVTQEEQYLALGIVSEDGRSLAESRSIVVSLVSTSFNSGFHFPDGEPSTPWFARAEGGREPVLITRVGCVMESPLFSGKRCTFLDWEQNVIREEVLTTARLVISELEPIFMLRLTSVTG